MKRDDTDEKKLRLFIAVPVPGQVKAQLGQAQKILSDANPHVRTVGIPGIHLTLKFLGETDPHRIGDIRRVMEVAAGRVQSAIHLHCATMGCFPDLERPRVLWAGLSGDVEPLVALWRDLDAGLVKFGFPRDERPLSPHLTLGRMKEPKMLGAFRKAWAKIDSLTFGDFTAEAIVLYRSELQPGGAVYTSLERVPLPERVAG